MISVALTETYLDQNKKIIPGSMDSRTTMKWGSLHKPFKDPKQTNMIRTTGFSRICNIQL